MVDRPQGLDCNILPSAVKYTILISQIALKQNRNKIYMFSFYANVETKTLVVLNCQKYRCFHYKFDITCQTLIVVL